MLTSSCTTLVGRIVCLTRNKPTFRLCRTRTLKGIRPRHDTTLGTQRNTRRPTPCYLAMSGLLQFSRLALHNKHTRRSLLYKRLAHARTSAATADYGSNPTPPCLRLSYRFAAHLTALGSLDCARPKDRFPVSGERKLGYSLDSAIKAGLVAAFIAPLVTVLTSFVDLMTTTTFATLIQLRKHGAKHTACR